MKKFIAFLLTMFLLSSFCYASEVHFDIERIEGTGLFYDLESGSISNQPNYVWPEHIDISLILEMPVPNITVVEINGEYYTYENGYITKIDGEFYWEGRRGERNMPLPVVPLGKEIPENLENFTQDWEPDLFPYNASNKNIVWENMQSKSDLPVRQASGKIAKWVVEYDEVNKRCSIFVNGIYRVETDISFRVYGSADPRGPYNDVLYWEDETYFYIKNYNLLLKTPKQPLYDALNALETLPVIKLNDTILAFECPPVIESDRTLVPMRFLFEQMGAEVSWDGETQTATVTEGTEQIEFSINNKTAMVNNASKTMDVPARLINNKTMVPLRFLSEELGYNVEWDNELRMATITE